MTTTILIPHYKNGKATAHAIYNILKYKGSHDVSIVVIDNNEGDGSMAYVEPFKEYYLYVPYPKDRLQSHGIAFDFALDLGYVDSEYFITIESDSYPSSELWLDDMEFFATNKFDIAGSLLQLSGGQYIHLCGTLYRKSLWEEAKKYCDAIEYAYFPNLSMKEGFACHLMVHNSILDRFCECPEDYIEVAGGKNVISHAILMEDAAHYKPVVNPFHNGMGTADESIRTYGQRTIGSETSRTLLDGKRKLINRIGQEPGQWLTYFAAATGKMCAFIPTEVKWMPNRENQQQEYTRQENGFTHIWAGSSFLDMKNTEMHDVYEFKKNQIDQLYEALPEHLKIKPKIDGN